MNIVLFGFVISRILAENYSWILNNFIISILLYFWLFIGLPMFIAYFVVFSLLQKKKAMPENSETGAQQTIVDQKMLQKKQFKIAVVSTMILGILISLFISWLVKPRFISDSVDTVQPDESTERSIAATPSTNPISHIPAVTPPASTPAPTSNSALTPSPTPTPVPTPVPDTTPPIFRSFTGPENGVVYSFNNFCFPMYVTDESPGEVQIRHKFDQENWSDWGKDYSPCYNNVENGAHQFSAQAKDVAGNETQIITRNFTIQALQ